jgi:hypothetical protein
MPYSRAGSQGLTVRPVQGRRLAKARRVKVLSQTRRCAAHPALMTIELRVFVVPTLYL